MNVRLYTIPGSHPGRGGAADARAQGHPVQAQRPLPGRLQGRRCGPPASRATRCRRSRSTASEVQGSRQIARELDRLQPEPPLFPADPEKRAAVEEAERFGDEELQHPIRQIIWWSLAQGRAADGAATRRAPKLGHADRLAGGEDRRRRSSPLSARFNEATDENVRADLEALGGLLRPVDELIAAGTINGAQLNAADFQIAPSITPGDDDAGPAPADRVAARRATWSAGSSRRSPATSRRSFPAAG